MTTKELVQMAELPDYYVQLIASARNAATINTLKIKPTAHKVGGSVAGVWAGVKAGIFPPPIKVSTRSVAWVEKELDALLAAKREMSRTRQSIDLRHFVALLVAPQAGKSPRL